MLSGGSGNSGGAVAGRDGLTASRAVLNQALPNQNLQKSDSVKSDALSQGTNPWRGRFGEVQNPPFGQGRPEP